jgi:hypothetical protein
MPKAKTKQKPQWMELFYDFIGNMTISSKELDSSRPVPLLDVLYTAQRRFLEEIAEGLDRGIHDFKCLKSRQLGVTTISLAVDVFWASVHDKLQGSLITDTDGNRDKFRILIEQYIESLPRGLRVGIKQHNRNNLVLMNGSVIDYLVAGTRGKKGALGTSRALNFLHATECSNWGSTDADIANLQASLAEKHPHRLYLWESTARGYGNEWYDMCESAKADNEVQKLFFLGWFLKEDYSFDEGTPEYDRWWDGKLSADEEEAQIQVMKESRWQITPGQWAWHRYNRTMKILDADLMSQNYPTTAKEAFIMTGRSFFPLKKIAEDIRTIHETSEPLKAFRYHMGENFLATELEQLESTRDADLRIWEEPHPSGVYVMGIDPAFGRSDFKDKHAIEVYRCYADKLVQVAEYASDVPETYQVTWVMAHLAGAYKNCILNLEVTGPGFAVMQELRHLRQLLDMGYLRGTASNMDLLDVFSSVKWYLYHRPDSMGAGYCYNWKTNQDNKLKILNQMRDNYTLRMLSVRSIPLLEEMERIVQDGGEIAAEGRAKDDRAFATALAVTAWIDWVRGGLIANGQTYDRVVEEERIAKDQPQATMVGRVVNAFFQESEGRRLEAEEARAWGIVDGR